MAGKRIDFEKLQVLYNLHNEGKSNRSIAAALGIYKATVNRYVNEAINEEGTRHTDYTKVESLARFFRQNAGQEDTGLHQKWLDYARSYPAARYGRSQFYVRYKAMFLVSRSCYQDKPPVNVEFGLDSLEYVSDDGEMVECPLLCATASGHAFIMAVEKADMEGFIIAMEKFFHLLGGVPDEIMFHIRAEVSAGELKDFTLYHGIKYRRNKYRINDGSVSQARRIVSSFKRHTFFSLKGINERLLEATRTLASEIPAGEALTRLERFTAIHALSIHELKSASFKNVQMKSLKVQSNCHVQVRGKDGTSHFYSVPCQYEGKSVLVEIGNIMVRIYSDNSEIASHFREFKPGYSTVTEHMASYAGTYGKHSPEKYIQKAMYHSIHLAEVFRHMFSAGIPEQKYRSCDMLLDMARKYYPPIFNAACIFALQTDNCSYATIKQYLSANRHAER